jgi:hypothetical protein
MLDCGQIAQDYRKAECQDIHILFASPPVSSGLDYAHVTIGYNGSGARVLWMCQYALEKNCNSLFWVIKQLTRASKMEVWMSGDVINKDNISTGRRICYQYVKFNCTKS